MNLCSVYICTLYYLFQLLYFKLNIAHFQPLIFDIEQEVLFVNGLDIL